MCLVGFMLDISVGFVGDGGWYEFGGKSVCFHSVLHFRAAEHSLTICFKWGFSHRPWCIAETVVMANENIFNYGIEVWERGGSTSYQLLNY